ncbi:2OG-Fe(II) oxygenase [bacterium]|nr:MAG: 2OG-Fe(II) oxygenase [bacterium]
MDLNQLLDQLYSQHYFISEDFIPNSLTQSLFEEGYRLWDEGDYRSARIGNGTDEQLKTEIRSDKIHWLNEQQLTPVQQEYWNRIDELRGEINRAFYFGLHDFEAHFAVYPEGSFYKKHLDQFAKTPYRFVTCLLYLNKDWKPEYGGQLRIYLPDSEDYFDVEPTFGKFVCFLSGSLYHEVLPSKRERFSLTGWLRKEKVLFGV